MSTRTVDCRIDQRILTLTLNRPEHLNAFSVDMARELMAAFQQAGSDDAVRAVIVTGAGKAFCAGMDLSPGGDAGENVFGLDESQSPSMHDLETRFDDPVIVKGVRDLGGRVALSIFNCPKPVIAAINGAAVGIGATMTLPMDIRLASSKARIGFVFGRIGIVPDACSSWFLPRIVGISRALEWNYSAEIFDGEEARRCGLVKTVYPPDELLAAAHELAHKLTDKRSPVGIAMTRQMLYRNAARESPLEAHKVESLAMFYASIGDGKEGVRSFLEKRDPEFTSRVSSDLPPFYPWWRS